MPTRAGNNSSQETSSSSLGGALGLAAKIVAAYISNNPVPVTDLAALIRNVHATLIGLASSVPSDAMTSQTPAVVVRKSVTPDFIVCLEDGKKLKMLKRYLRSRFKLTPEQYRTKWGLQPDYPMVAPNYSARRSEFAKKIGLGRIPPNTRQRRKA
jgi:predicted transcriptional regulator